MLCPVTGYPVFFFSFFKGLALDGINVAGLAIVASLFGLFLLFLFFSLRKKTMYVPFSSGRTLG